MTIRDGKLHGGVARDASGAARRKMTLSAALRWAWGDELPKEPAGAFYGPPLAAASAWSAILRYGELNSIVDRQPNRYGCIPFDRPDYPHDDALVLAGAVADLAGCTVDVPEGWHPMPEIAAVDAPLVRAAVIRALQKATDEADDGALTFRTRPDTLIVRHAILGLVPDWRLAALPQVCFEAGDNGVHRWFVRREVRSVIGTLADGSDRIEVTTVEVDGWSKRLRRPVAGAYRKPYLDPNPVPVMVARAEYEIFCAAMAMLADAVAGRLATIELVPDEWPAQPWAGDSVAARREPKILPDLRSRAALSQSSERRTKTRRKRPVAVPRKGA